MRSIEQLLELAKRHSKLPTDKALADQIGRSTSHVSSWRTRRAIASDADIVALAALAGISPRDAILDHAVWKHQDKPEVANAYKAIVDALKSSAAALLLLLISSIPGPADAGTNPAHSAVNRLGTIHYATSGYRNGGNYPQMGNAGTSSLLETFVDSQ